MSEPDPPCHGFLRHREELAAAAREGPVLDVACGRGRHALAAATLGARVVGLDRNADALRALAGAARARGLPVAPLRWDLETGHALPLAPGRFAAVLVFRYLHRPLADALAAALRPGGLLLYETFTIHQRDLPQGPSNPAFLLEPGELPRLFPGLRVEAHWEGRTPGPRPAALARLAARRPAA